MIYSFEDEWVDGREVAKILRLKTHRTLLIWRDLGKYPELEYIKIGQAVLYKLNSVKKFAETWTGGRAHFKKREKKNDNSANKATVRKRSLARKKIQDPEV